MLGINLLFVGFVLLLNGISYLIEVDDNVKGLVNALIGVVVAINAIFEVSQGIFASAAGMWIFALNYFIVAAHIFFGSKNWKILGIYGLFVAIVCMVFIVDSVLAGAWVLVYLWAMWGILWIQGFFSIVCGSKLADKYTPHVLIINGIASCLVPGLLVLLEIMTL